MIATPTNDNRNNASDRTMCRSMLVALAAASFITVSLVWPQQVKADSFTFEVQPGSSSVDMTLFSAFYFLSTTGSPTRTADTQTIPLAGSITLDVDISGGTVTNVDFVSLKWFYLAGMDDPVVFENRTIDYSSLEQLSGGAAQNVHLPFDPDVASGNPVPVKSPVLTLDTVDAGLETGLGGDLQLEGAQFAFEGTGQYFFPELDRSGFPLRDGFPVQLGPYPEPVEFPSEIPLSLVTDGDGNVVLNLVDTNNDGVIDEDDGGFGDATVDQTMPSPTGPNFLDGMVSLNGQVLTFEADFLSYGLGGSGLVKSAMIHNGSVVATAIIPEPASLTLLALMGLSLTSRRRR